MEPFEHDRACPIPEPMRNRLGTLVFLSGLFFLSFLARIVFAFDDKLNIITMWQIFP